MSLKLKGNGTINHTVQLVTDLANISNPEVDDICIVTDENRGGTFVYRGTGADDNGTIFSGWHRQYEGAVNIKWFGAVIGDFIGNADAIESAYAISNSYVGLKVITPSGGFGINREVNIPSAFTDSEFIGFWYAMDGFSGDYMVNCESADYTPQFYYPTVIKDMWLKCRFLTRGLRTYNADHLTYYNPRVENSLGSAFSFDRLRESVVFMPKAINCAHREAFDDSEVARTWQAGVTDTVGDIVLRTPDDIYDAGTTYDAGTVVLYLDENWISSLNDNVGNTPSVTSEYWRRVPKQHYICLISNNSQDPLVQNTNATDAADHYWKKVYQDEALFNVVDDVELVADRQNQVSFYSPICRDSDNKCLFRIDNNRNSSSNTHINIYSGHIHHIGVNAIGDYPEITGQEDVRCLELGRTINCNIQGTNIFTADRPQGIAVLVGDLGSKTTSSLRLQSAIATDGINQTGIIVMPSVTGSDKNIIEPAYVVNNPTNNVQIIDPIRFTRRFHEGEQYIRVAEGANNQPYGNILEMPNDWGIARYAGYRREGDSNDRVRFETTSAGTSRLSFGNGTNTPDATIERKGTNRVGVASGDTWEIGGTWNVPMRINTRWFWVDSNSQPYISSSAPSNETDGEPLSRLITVVPSSSSDSGVKGQYSFDSSYVYFCVAENTWVRSSISSF